METKPNWFVTDVTLGQAWQDESKEIKPQFPEAFLHEVVTQITRKYITTDLINYRNLCPALVKQRRGKHAIANYRKNNTGPLRRIAIIVDTASRRDTPSQP